jgi:hypothetical protein
MASPHYPSPRLTLPDGRVLLQEGLSFRFFMRRPHGELSSAIRATLKRYIDTIPSGRLGWYVDEGGDIDPDEYKGWAGTMRPLDDACWARIREELNDPVFCSLQLQEHRNQAGDFHFEYHGRAREVFQTGFVSHVSFWLPMGWLETKGAPHVQELARAVARELPFDSGYVSPAFHSFVDTEAVLRFIGERCLNLPGMDIPQFDASMTLGTRVRGAYWLNFYGPSVLEQLGGSEHLRARLALPGVSVENLGADKLLVSLGEQPEVSSGEATSGFQAYRLLARVLEPLLYEPAVRDLDPARQQWRSWRRRFLD